jgi:hypothetical protein
MPLLKSRQLVSVFVLISVANSPFANSPIPTASKITIHFQGVGSDHIFRALEKLATPVGFVCSPSMSDYAQGRVYGKAGIVTRKPDSMACKLFSDASSQSYTAAGSIRVYILAPGEMSIDVYYEWPSVEVSVAKPKVDGVIANLEAAIKGDPLVKSIDQSTWSPKYVYSKIK